MDSEVMPESYHFIGIGGSGMSGLARLLLADGEAVSGSDLRDSATTQALRSAGARVMVGHRSENLAGATRVVYTAAAREDNPELVEARRRGVPTIVRAEMLARVMRGKTGIAIAGTHGKTTTTGMAASVFLAAERDPTVLIGGDWSVINGNARPGRGQHFIAEACEAFNSFLELQPHAAIITNVEADHLDCHGSLEGVVEAFRQFLSRLDADGYAIGCRDDELVRHLLSRLDRRSVTYGLEDGADYVAVDLDLDRPHPTFTVVGHGQPLGEVRLGVPGRHNVLNALAVAALAMEEGLPFHAVTEGLAHFHGVGRRFETLGEVDDIVVVDDYAHHPTEVRATLAAARRSLGRYTTVVFQPHLFSRTQLLLDEFARSFADANRVIITPIYAAREQPLEGVTSEALVRRIQEVDAERQVEYAPDRTALVARLASDSRPGDLILTMGAGDIRETGEQLVEALRKRG
ncbi:MAG TPA: UDP-N-acetylmuramate--L-alanine ligase [Armatimonadota bacterium]|nr:UDP-N-acetylmuramate--L-alanine ligase [Armatimonadota bacterium]